MIQYLRQLDSCFGNEAKRISRNPSNIGVSGNRYSFPKQQITTNSDFGEGIDDNIMMF